MFKVHHGDCLEVMPGMPADSFHSIVTDPPYGLEFMGKHWDHGIPGVQFWKEALRVARPGAHLLAFGGTRTHHRLMVAIEDAGWIIRDVLSWLYGSGFPKSLNIGQESGLSEWAGWGTGLCPSWEPIILAMKPMPGTFAQNAANFGVAGINIDASRIEAAPGELTPRNNKPGDNGWKNSSGGYIEPSPLGRWPKNTILDEEAAAMVDEQSGIKKGGKYSPPNTRQRKRYFDGVGEPQTGSSVAPNNYGDSGGASRFFKNVASEPVCYLCGLPINEGHGIMTGKGDHLLWSKSAKNAETNSAQRITEAINDSATTNVQREQPQRSGGKPEPSNENANNAGNRIGDTQANASGFVPTNAELDRFGKIAQNVPIAENLCDLCGTSIVLSIAVMQLGRSPESIVGQVFIPAHKKQTLMQCLVSFAGALGSTDTIPTTENLILWFGYVRDAMRNSIPTEGTADVQAQTSRLFYRSKASKADRDDGLEGMEEQLAKSKFNLNNGSGDLRFDGAPTPTRKNIHPTVKPTELMRYLCAMVTPEGGRVLDPFMGSGSTGRGAMMGGFLFEGIEREAEYIEIAQRRIAAIKPQPIQGRFI